MIKKQIRELTWQERRGVDPDRIGENLKELRKRNNLTQSDLQKLLGLNYRTTISNWERARCIPTIENFVRLSVVYGISLQDLILGYAPDLSDHKDRSFYKCDADIKDFYIDKINVGKTLKHYRNIHCVVDASGIHDLTLDRLQGIFEDSYETWSKEAIYACEHGKSLPSTQHLYYLSRLYGIKMDDLVRITWF